MRKLLPMRNTQAGGNSSVRLWLQLMKCTKTIETHIGGRFRRAHSQSLARFDVLSQLYRFGGDWMTIGQLADLMMASGGNITGLLDRMENENLLIRRASPTDRRSNQVKMTVEGRKLFHKLKGDHEKWMNEILADIDPEDEARLIDLLIDVRRAFELTLKMKSRA